MTNDPQREKTRVLIVDDHALVRAGLRMLIESRAGMEVAAEAGSTREALEAASREQPDIVILDVDLSGQDGLGLIAELRSASPASRIIVVTGAREASVHRRAVRLSAMGLVLKDKAADVLLKAIEKVQEGEVWFDRAVIGAVLSEMAGGGCQEDDAAGKAVGSLSAREREIVALLCLGLKNKEIGRRLNIKGSTVGHHLTNIFTKMGVSDRLELVMFAFNHRLATPSKVGGLSEASPEGDPAPAYA